MYVLRALLAAVDVLVTKPVGRVHAAARIPAGYASVRTKPSRLVVRLDKSVVRPTVLQAWRESDVGCWFL